MRATEFINVNKREYPPFRTSFKCKTLIYSKPKASQTPFLVKEVRVSEHSSSDGIKDTNLNIHVTVNTLLTNFISITSEKR